jgi:hypothetical protein
VRAAEPGISAIAGDSDGIDGTEDAARAIVALRSCPTNARNLCTLQTAAEPTEKPRSNRDFESLASSARKVASSMPALQGAQRLGEEVGRRNCPISAPAQSRSAPTSAPGRRDRSPARSSGRRGRGRRRLPPRSRRRPPRGGGCLPRRAPARCRRTAGRGPPTTRIGRKPTSGCGLDCCSRVIPWSRKRTRRGALNSMTQCPRRSRVRRQ